MKTASKSQKLALRGKAHVDLDTYIEKKLRNREFRAAYEAESKRIDLILGKAA